MDTLVGVGFVALTLVILILGVIALRRCPPEDIADVLRALSRFVGHLDHPASRPSVRPVRRCLQLGAGTGPPRRQDSRRPTSGRDAARRRQRRGVRNLRPEPTHDRLLAVVRPGGPSCRALPDSLRYASLVVRSPRLEAD